MSELLEAQFIFAKNIARLILWAFEQGYKLTLGEGYDDDNQGHKKDSLHYIKLAQDLNLFIDGEWKKDSESHARLGAAWKALDPRNRWGGDFTNKDGNHYSMEFQGKA